MKQFSDLPENNRLELRKAIESIGGCVNAYNGDLICVSCPDDELFSTKAFDLGFRCVTHFYFPLGSDNPPKNMRHAIPCKYDGAKSFWKYASFYHISQQ